MTTLRHVRRVLSGRSHENGWDFDTQVRHCLNELVACGDLADDEVDWATLESRAAALESWSRK